MRFSDDLKEMVLQGSSTAELKVAAIKGGMSTLRMSGIRKIMARHDHDRRGPPRYDGRLTMSPHLPRRQPNAHVTSTSSSRP